MNENDKNHCESCRCGLCGRIGTKKCSLYPKTPCKVCVAGSMRESVTVNECRGFVCVFKRNGYG